MSRIESVVSRRSRYAAGPVRRLRQMGAWLGRAPWVLVSAFLALGVAATVSIFVWPVYVPWGVYAFVVVLSGLFLEPRLLLVVYIGLFLAMSILGAYLGELKPANTGAADRDRRHHGADAVALARPRPGRRRRGQR